MIYIVFQDEVDLYFARARVLERMNLVGKLLPAGAVPTLGPDATGVGHVFWYTVESPTYLRAEGERRGLRTGAAVDAHSAMGMSSASPSSSNSQTASVTVGDAAFEPAMITLRKGVPARVTFTRISDKTCATEVVFPDYGIKQALPLNKGVVIEFTPQTAGDVAFACGMAMMKGTVIVR